MRMYCQRRRVSLGIMFLFAVATIVGHLRFIRSTSSVGHHKNPTIRSGRDSWNDDFEHLRQVPGSNTSAKIGMSAGLHASSQSPNISTSAVRDTPLSTKVQVSAREALSRKINLDRCKVHKLGSSLVQANNTVVAAYYRVASKHSFSEYDEWIRNFLSIEDPVVVFTQPSMVKDVIEMRAHAANRTVVVECEIEVLPIISLGQGFWTKQLEVDPEASVHKSYQLFWIWLSKTWLTAQAVHLNFFSSRLFTYIDIGSFRNGMYNNKTIVKYPEVVPDSTILWMAHRHPNPPPTLLWTNKKPRKHFYHSGSHAAGKGDAWINFHSKFSAVLDSFIAEELFVGEDQCVLQATCLLYPSSCAYVLFSEVKDNPGFGLRYVLHYGPESAVNSVDRRYHFWRPPGWNSSSSGLLLGQ